MTGFGSILMLNSAFNTSDYSLDEIKIESNSSLRKEYLVFLIFILLQDHSLVMIADKITKLLIGAKIFFYVRLIC
jgi:hypothetical protein